MPVADPINLSRTPIHLDQSASAQLLHDFDFDGPSFEAYVAKYCSESAPGRLVMMETTAADWKTWERHPLGDELVIILEGAGDFIQQQGDQEVRIAVGPGDTIVNPAGVWHTADVRESIRAVYITPCPGTDHKPRA